MSEIIEKLSMLAAKQKLVPFMGAGCSSSMMPDWDTLIADMSKELGLDSKGDNLEVAQKYVDTFGREKFCEFLKNKLEISEFDDEKGYIHLMVMNMGVRTIYTTNQDNVMEKAYEKYGKKHRAIIRLEDFAETKLSEQLYIKFHGDLNLPESIVFTTDDYKRRMNEQENALNIQLRADLLAKNLFFIGYSFRDINIQQMFEELQKAFYGKLPTSYMIAYKYSDELQALCDKYGIQLINPQNEFPESKTNAEAFEKFLRCLIVESRSKKSENEIEEMFSPMPNIISKVVSIQEIEVLESIINKKQLSTCIHMFREVCDASKIPLDYEERIVNIFIELCKQAKTNEDTEALKASIFNLKIINPLNKLNILTVLMATAYARTSDSKYGEDHFFIHMNDVTDKFYMVTSAKAIEYIYNWGIKPTQTFCWNIYHWMDMAGNYDLLPENIQKYISHWVDILRNDCRTVAENPIKRQRRLNDIYNNINRNMLTKEEIETLNKFIEQEI
ncbi:SIR2 family NAD-dependent protein deacylase [Clostridium butyricum]|uniref:SIR2 family NAD-dependent protein deacylase n=1 Tax=Clostridium butyricum TaxID=1492 RepID=UPI002ABE4547|nr:SIR2 family protein [Clostridium butyricum]